MAKKGKYLAIHVKISYFYAIIVLAVIMNNAMATTETKKSNVMNTSKLFATSLALIAATAALSAAEVKETWEKSCIKCHGADGKGDTKLGKKVEVKDFTDAKYQETFTDDKAFKTIKEGLKDGEKAKMKPLEGATDEEIKALIKQVRSFKK